MLDDITDLYKKEFENYKEIHKILNSFEDNTFNINDWEVSLQNIEFLMQRIKILNDKCEQQKQIYVMKNNLKDFKGNEIKAVEPEKEYLEFKLLIDNLGQEILDVKKLQDSVINRMNSELNSAKTLLNKFNNQRKSAEGYEKLGKTEKNTYIDIKK